MPTMASTEKVLIKLRPPTTDTATYLTYLEENLRHEHLDTLQDLLEDELLARLIGWDLIHILLPLLPDSMPCMRILAQRGNPRELVLKIAESLQNATFDEKVEDGDDEDIKNESLDPLTSTCISPPYTTPIIQKDRYNISPPRETFEMLLDMLATLHPRIDTNYPSRFISTTLQAVLLAFCKAANKQRRLIQPIARFVSAIHSANTRKTCCTGNILIGSSTNLDKNTLAPEARIVLKLLQSFVVHVLESYVENLSERDDPGFCWSSGLQKTLNSAKAVPHNSPFSGIASSSRSMKERHENITSLILVAEVLGIDSNDLFSSLSSTGFNQVQEEEFPSSAESIPYPNAGSLLLLVARRAKYRLDNDKAPPNSFLISPHHEMVLSVFLKLQSAGEFQLPSPSIVDAILYLGLEILQDRGAASICSNDEGFQAYLHKVALLSALSPSPSLRYNAYWLTSRVLESHPRGVVRLSFIRDTLEHCPYANLKAAAIGWLKDEIVSAAQARNKTEDPEYAEHAEKRDIFQSPHVLRTAGQAAFPDVRCILRSPSEVQWTRLMSNFTFYMAALNFCYFLLKASFLHQVLKVREALQTINVWHRFVNPICQVVERLGVEINDSRELRFRQESEPALLDLLMMESVLARVAEAAYELKILPGGGKTTGQDREY